jgi:hypothetical protein
MHKEIATMSNVDISAIKLGQLQISSKGAKQVPLLLDDDKSIFMQLGPLSTLFEPSAFGDANATRVNLVLSTNTDVEERLQELDAHIVKLLLPETQKLFGAALSEAQLLDRMQPSIRTSDKGYKSCKMKMNLSGRNAVQIFGMDKSRRDAPESWVGSNVIARVQVKSVWLMNKEWGVLYEAPAVQVECPVADCPF